MFNPYATDRSKDPVKLPRGELETMQELNEDRRTNGRGLRTARGIQRADGGSRSPRCGPCRRIGRQQMD